MIDYSAILNQYTEIEGNRITYGFLNRVGLTIYDDQGNFLRRYKMLGNKVYKQEYRFTESVYKEVN